MSRLIKEINYNNKITEIGNKLPSFSGLVTTAALPDITNITTKGALNTKAARGESNILCITYLATKAAINTKVIEIENKIINTTDFITTLNLLD